MNLGRPPALPCLRLAAVIAAALMGLACDKPAVVTPGNLKRPADLALLVGTRDRPPVVFAAASADNVVRVFDLGSGQAIAAPVGFFPLEVPVGRFPIRVMLTPDEKYLLVLNAVSRDISAVRLQGLRETDWEAETGPSRHTEGNTYAAGITRIELVGEPADMLYLPAAPERAASAATLTRPPTQLSLWVAEARDDGSGLIAVYDADTTQLPSAEGAARHRGNIELSGKPVGLRHSRDGTTVYTAIVAGERYEIVALDTARAAVTATYPLPALPRDFAVVETDAGRYFYVIDRQNPNVWIIDAQTRAFVDPSPQGPPAAPPQLAFPRRVPLHLAVTPGVVRVQDRIGMYVFAICMDGSVFAIDASGSELAGDDDLPVPGTRRRAHRFEDSDDTKAQILPPKVRSGGEEFAAATSPGVPLTLPRFAGEFDNPAANFGVEIADGRAPAEQWQLVYEGTVPGTDLTPGLWIPANPEHPATQPGAHVFTDGAADFEAQGVRAGDRLILSRPVQASFSCPELPATGLELAIARVTGHELEAHGALPEACVPARFPYRVAVTGAWTVTGDISGFAGRARAGEQFQFPAPPAAGEDGWYVRFTVKDGSAETKPGTEILFRVIANESLMMFQTFVLGQNDFERLPGIARVAEIRPGAFRLLMAFEGTNGIVDVDLRRVFADPILVLR